MTENLHILKIQAVSKVFASAKKERITAVNDVSFDVKKSEFFTLLGPSGCGKSTLLRCIAGIELPDMGEIKIGPDTVFCASKNQNVAANRRQLAMVFQSFAIWPHMSVFENVAFGLRAIRKRNNWPKHYIQEKTDQALTLVSMNLLSARRGADLSGGQKQRLALARAIAAEPKLILLDEPLSNLDAKLRERLRGELKELQSKLGLSFVYVTHDQQEALSMSDRIAVMNDGKIQQIGTPEDIYRRPANRFVAEFFGKSSQATANENQLIRPEDIQISTEPQSGIGWYACQFVGQQYFGDHVEISVNLDGRIIDVKVPANFNSPKNRLLYLKFNAAKLIQF